MIQARNVNLATFNSITVKGNYGDSLASPDSKIGVQTIVEQSGSNLTVSSAGVRIGAGITKIMVSGSIFYVKDTAEYGWGKILTSNNHATATTITGLRNGYGSASIAPMVLDVTEGEIIYLWNIDSGSKVRGTDCWLTIQQIG